MSRSIDDETIIVPVRGGVGDLDAVFTLSPVGARIWSLIDGATSIERLAEAVAAEYDVAADVAAHDVDDFVQTLSAKGLLERAVPSAETP